MASHVAQRIFVMFVAVDHPGRLQQAPAWGCVVRVGQCTVARSGGRRQVARASAAATEGLTSESHTR